MQNPFSKLFFCINCLFVIRFPKKSFTTYFTTNLWLNTGQKIVYFITEKLKIIQRNAFSGDSFCTLGRLLDHPRGGISGMNLVQMCRWAPSYPPYKCILEYGKSIPINVYTIIGDNIKYSLFPLRLGSFMQTNHQFSQILDYKLIFIRKQQD